MTFIPKFVESVGGAGLLLAKSVVYFPYVVFHGDSRRDLFRQL